MGTVSPIARGARSLVDGLTNLYSRLGTGADRNTHNRYYAPILTQQEIEAAYRSSWLTRKVHDLVPFEMTRAGRSWKAAKDQIQKLEAAERSLCLWAKLASCLRTARLHGGSALVLGVRQGLPDQPLRVDALGVDSLRYAVVVSRHQLFAPWGFEQDPESDFFGQPAMWEMRGQKGNTVRIHPSRVIPFHGAPLPPGAISTSQLDTFWGDPLLLSIKSAIDNAEVSQAAVATLLHEMKIDTISIPGLTEQIATEGAEKLLAARIEAIARFRSMFNFTLLDGGELDGNGKQVGGEKWETRQLSFAQHPELLRQFVAIVAGAGDITVTRLMGESPGGLQSTGKGEQDDMDRMVEARQKTDLTGQLMRIDEILIRSTLGSRPPEIYSEFSPLSKITPAQAAEIEAKEAESVAKIVATNLIPVDAMGKVVLNRMVESGRWPGLDQAVEDSAEEPGEAKQEATQLSREAANENNVLAMEQRGQVTRDQAMLLLTDATPRSLYVRRDVLNIAELRAWAKEQGLPELQDGLHVTLAHIDNAVDWMAIDSDSGWSSDDSGSFTVAPGGVRIVEPLGNRTAVLLFTSGPLSWRHESILRAVDERDKWPSYQPHISLTGEPVDLSNVEPYRGALVLGPEIFEEANP